MGWLRNRDHRQAAPVLILGCGLTALGVMRCLGRAGIKAYFACPPVMSERYSRWYRVLSDSWVEITEESDLAARLEQLPLSRMVLMPCSDSWTLKAAALPDSLKERFPSSLSSLEVQEFFVDKGKFRQLAARVGVPHPKTLFVEDERDLADIPDSDFPRYFLKPRDSQRFSKRYELKGFWCESREHCARRLQEMRAAGCAMVVQEYIPGPTTNHFHVEGLVDASGRICCTLTRQRIRMAPPDLGNATYMISIPAKRIAAAVESTRKLLAGSGYRGIYSAEFKFDERDRQFKILEINARPWWYVEFSERCGVNLPALAYHDALGLPLPKRIHYRVGLRNVHFLPDFALWRRLPRKAWSWIPQWIFARHSVLPYDDPLPGLLWPVMRIMGKFSFRMPRKLAAQGGEM